MNYYLLIVFILLILIYLKQNKDGFLDYKKSCALVKPNTQMEFKVVGGTLSNRITKKDYGFIKNIKRTYYGKHYKTADIEYGELKEIIAKFGRDYENSEIDNYSISTSRAHLNRINVFIMDYLNKHIKSYLLKQDIHIINTYKIINQDIIYIGVGEINYRYRFIISIFRFGTDMYFNIYFDIVSSKLKKVIKINSVRIIGVKIKTDTISEEYNKCIVDNKHCNMDEECDINCNNILQQDPDFKMKLYDFTTQVKKENFKLTIEDSFRCYKKYKTSYTTEPKLDRMEICEDNKGTWDRPCLSDSECPFFNITSQQGGCENSECVIPWGIERYSPMMYNKESEPFCKGCRKGYRCCSSQNPPNYIFMDTTENRDPRFNS